MSQLPPEPHLASSLEKNGYSFLVSLSVITVLILLINGTHMNHWHPNLLGFALIGVGIFTFVVVRRKKSAKNSADHEGWRSKIKDLGLAENPNTPETKLKLILDSYPDDPDILHAVYKHPNFHQ